MKKYSLEEIGKIIFENRNKAMLDKARADRAKYNRHVHGHGCKESMTRMEYFESAELFSVKKQLVTSNKDLFERILKEEQQVFTARGGSVRYNLPDGEEKKMNARLDDVRYGISLHKWVEKIAYEARKVDPQGVIFVEIETLTGGVNELKSYPTYKSTECIHEYESAGRELNYICFRISSDEYAAYGIKESEANTENVPSTTTGGFKYFRWIDGMQDVIVKMEDKAAVEVKNPEITGTNPLVNPWGKVPGFILSDLIRFDNPKCFNSPLENVIELADDFLNDRTDRNIQKKLHGFAKAIEPLLKCITCKGEGLVDATACPDCTPTGHSRGTGYKIKTKVSDVVKFPVEMLAEITSFSFEKIFGYVTPPIEVWDKQDRNLEAIEGLIYYTYWGTPNVEMTGFNGENQEETATKTLTNLQPKYAQLNATANWAEDTENKIANLLGYYYYRERWQGANIRYGRNYILETAQDLAREYYEMCAKGANESLKDEALQRYIMALYQNNPIQQAKYLKLLRVIPFPHDKPETIENSPYVVETDKLMKRYGGEWESSVGDMFIIDPKNTVAKLQKSLKDFATKKQKELTPIEVEESKEKIGFKK